MPDLRYSHWFLQGNCVWSMRFYLPSASLFWEQNSHKLRSTYLHWSTCFHSCIFFYIHFFCYHFISHHIYQIYINNHLDITAVIYTEKYSKLMYDFNPLFMFFTYFSFFSCWLQQSRLWTIYLYRSIFNVSCPMAASILSFRRNKSASWLLNFITSSWKETLM